MDQLPQRAAALRTAINTHSKTTLNAMMGKGCGVDIPGLFSVPPPPRYPPRPLPPFFSFHYRRAHATRRRGGPKERARARRSVDRHLFALRKLYEKQNPGKPLPDIFSDQGT